MKSRLLWKMFQLVIWKLLPARSVQRYIWIARLPIALTILRKPNWNFRNIWQEPNIEMIEFCSVLSISKRIGCYLIEKKRNLSLTVRTSLSTEKGKSCKPNICSWKDKEKRKSIPNDTRYNFPWFDNFSIVETISKNKQ